MAAQASAIFSSAAQPSASCATRTARCWSFRRVANPIEYENTIPKWDAPAERKNLGPSHPESTEALFHEVDVPNFFLDLRKNVDVTALLRNERLERAIGVIYRPDTELISHYFHARLPDQFDAILHYDHTRAVETLERTAEGEMGEVEETFPSGL
jgi:hypothetical protein